MRRFVLLLAVSTIFAASLGRGRPREHQHRRKDFGQNISDLARMFGPVFGQTASGSAPLNDTVEQEQLTFCGP
jgi:hypothetical protein